MRKTPREPRNRQILREEWGEKGGIDMKELIKVFEAPTKNTLLGTGMRSILSKKVGFWTVVLLSTLSISTGVLAQDTSYVKEGMYVGFNLTYNTISGDFDGQSALVSATEIIVIPKVESNMGFGALLGVRFKKGALELSYQRSEHDDTSVLGKGTTVYNIVDIDFKIYPSAESQMQPYLLLGMGIPWLVVRDGAYTATAVGDGTLRGLGFNIGGGVSYYLQPTICVNGGVTYRLISYSTATGVSGISNTIQDGLGGSGLTLKGGITFTF